VNRAQALRLGVGPVLHATPLARAIAAAIQSENDDVVVRDEGAYLRVLALRVCRVSATTVEAEAGVPVEFPGDLELVMSSFTGLVDMNEDGAVWWLASEAGPGPPARQER
jgi:toluene monooxygenase system protein D